MSPRVDPALTRHLLQFVNCLRSAGIRVDTSRFMDYARAVAIVGIGDRDVFRLSARTTLIDTRRDYELFERIFESYWSGGTDPIALPCFIHREGQGSPAGMETPGTVFETAPGEVSEEEGFNDAGESWSPRDTVRRKDLAHLSSTEIEAAQSEIERIARYLAYECGRRRRASRKMREIHFRRLLRNSALRPMDLTIPYRQEKRNRSKLFVLCDVSGSMDRYSRFFLHLLYALKTSFGQTRVALFSTRTVDITAYFDRDSPRPFLDHLSRRVTEWSGGTRMGNCFLDFLDLYGEKMRPSSAVTVIISDGWDTGDADTLYRAIITLRQRSRKILWLNPLLGEKDYQPLCRGIRTVLPHVDYFIPAHNVESLRKAVIQISSLM